MLTIYKANGEIMRTIPNDAFFEDISSVEILGDHIEFDQDYDWGVDVSLDTRIISLCAGNLMEPILIFSVSNSSIRMIKKYWYIAYCEAHGYSYAYTNDGEMYA